VRFLKYLWPFPATAAGVIFVFLAWFSRGKVRIVNGVVEVHGGVVTVFLRDGLLVFGRAAARTMGHVVIGRDQECLDRCRRHEHVHVRQFERWGPLFPPMYLGASLVARLRHLDPYHDNVFEVEAMAAEETGEPAG
jgi:hypothetical protein